MRSNIRNAGSRKGSVSGRGGNVLDEMAGTEQSVITSGVVCTILFILYIVLGVSYYTMICGHDALTSAYFCITTLMTIGYGDVAQPDHAFSTFFILFGAGVLGTFVGIVASNVMEQEEAKIDERLDALGDKFFALLGGGEDPFVGTNNSQDAEAAAWNDPASRRLSVAHDLRSMDAMNTYSYEKEIKDMKISGLINLIAVMISMFVGAAAMSSLEGWSFTDAVYWSAVTITSVGLGDISPQTDGGKIFTIFYALFGCIVTVKGLSDVVRFPIAIRAKEQEMRISKQFLRGLSEKTMIGLIENDLFDRVPKLKLHPKELRKSEFVVMLLFMMGKVAEKDIMMAAKMFERIDDDDDGVVVERDWTEELKRARQRDVEREAEQAAKLDEDTLPFESLMLRGFGSLLHRSNSKDSLPLRREDLAAHDVQHPPRRTGPGPGSTAVPASRDASTPVPSPVPSSPTPGFRPSYTQPSYSTSYSAYNPVLQTGAVTALEGDGDADPFNAPGRLPMSLPRARDVAAPAPSAPGTANSHTSRSTTSSSMTGSGPGYSPATVAPRLQSPFHEAVTSSRQQSADVARDNTVERLVAAATPHRASAATPVPAPTPDFIPGGGAGAGAAAGAGGGAGAGNGAGTSTKSSGAPLNPFRDLPPPRSSSSSSSSPSPSQARMPPPEEAPEVYHTPLRSSSNNSHSAALGRGPGSGPGPGTGSTTRRSNQEQEQAQWDNIMNNMWSPG